MNMENKNEPIKTQEPVTKTDPIYDTFHPVAQYDPIYFLIRIGESIIYRSKNNLIVRIFVWVVLLIIMAMVFGVFSFLPK
jgi:ABC-type multidrug transport system permease subunit